MPTASFKHPVRYVWCLLVLQTDLCHNCVLLHLQQGINKANIRFLLDGDTIGENDTAYGLEMEDGDVINVWYSTIEENDTPDGLEMKDGDVIDVKSVVVQNHAKKKDGNGIHVHPEEGGIRT